MKHIKILGRGACPGILSSGRAIQELVRASVQAAGMTLLGMQLHEVEPDLQKLGREPFEDEGGISVLGCLSTSHVAIHTWPLRGEFHMDLYSCRSFNGQLLTRLVRDALGATELQVTDCSAGCEWKPDARAVRPWPGPLRIPGIRSPSPAPRG